MPAPPWDGVLDATHYGPRCLQDLGGDLELGRQSDEDCLNLNVWTPAMETAAESSDKRPVMVWIHGGSFVNGSGRVYDARRLVAGGDIIVVTINYRLGALGFLAHPSLGPPGQVGNYGLADQQAALRWVRDNIEHFGGDPTRITLAGESAGGMSVCDHLVAPESKGLFASAIIMSAPCQAQASLQVAQDRSVDYASALGCADLAFAAKCLRALPADTLRAPVWFYNIGEDELSGPVTGTSVLPQDPVDEIEQGRAAPVPVMIGTTRDEFTLFAALQYLRDSRRYTAEEYPGLLADTFGDNADEVARRYPLSRFDSVAVAYSVAVTDGVFSCPAVWMAGGLARNAPVYAYEFADRDAPKPQPLRELPFPVGAAHSLELRYLFDVGGAPELTPTQRELADDMIGYWSSFVAGDNPTAAGAPDWPSLSDGSVPQWMSLQTRGPQLIDQARFADDHQCAFWADLRR